MVGANGYTYASDEVRVECYPWDRLKKVPNLADYDIVILNALESAGSTRMDGDVLKRILDVRTTQEVLRKRGGAFYVLGDPRFEVTWRSDEGEQSAPFLYWTGVEFAWDERPGDTLERHWDAGDRGRFKPFADALSRWKYSLAGARPIPEAFAEVWNVEYLRSADQQIAVLVDPICDTSYGNHVMFSVSHAQEQVMHQYGLQVSGPKEVLSSPVYFLPESELSEEETLELVLRNLCGADVSAPEPEWVSEFMAPGQDEVDREITALEGQIRELMGTYDRKYEERDEVRKPLKLLYETGSALEVAVWSVLEALGAEVERPEDRTKEDGWISVRIGDETFEGVLEIKGVGGRHFNLGGLRQLTDWIERGMSFRKKKYHGVFVGNSAIGEPPRSRIWPFNNNWVEQAEMRGYAAVRTEDLYVLYLLDQTGRLPDREEFWRALFAAEGPLDARPYRERLAEEEREQLDNAPGP